MPPLCPPVSTQGLWQPILPDTEGDRLVARSRLYTIAKTPDTPLAMLSAVYEFLGNSANLLTPTTFNVHLLQDRIAYRYVLEPCAISVLELPPPKPLTLSHV